MYFNEVDKVDLYKLIRDGDKVYAHILNDRKETLKEHIDLALEYLHNIIKSKNLDNVFLNFENRFISNFSNKGKSLYREMLLNTIYMHDLGKINCNFQYLKMNNKEVENLIDLNLNNSNHSMLSSLIYINHYFSKINKHDTKSEQSTLRLFMLLNSYIISKHHGSLDSFGEYKEKFLSDGGEGKKLYTDEISIYKSLYKEEIVFNEKNQLIKRIFENVEKTLSSKETEEKEISLDFYIYERFISSLLLSCDYYATSHFKNEREIDNLGEINDIDKFYKIFKETDVYKWIRKYEEESYGKVEDFKDVRDINILRNEMFLDAEKNFLKNIDKNIFYLEAPTGSGKSNVSLNLSFRMIENFDAINKIFYVYPFNNLVEQNINTLDKIFGNSRVIDDIAIINSVVPIKTKDKVKEKAEKKEDSDVIDKDYQLSLLDRQFLHYSMILTTHVSIFNYLFGTSKENLFPLAQIANSIVILDEIQSYKNNIWKEIITFLKHYSELLNTKFVIMSATLPDLNKLIEGEIETVSLIENREKYFSNPIFKDRVELDFSLLEVEEDVLEVLLSHVINTSKENKKDILIEFIKKTTAMEFYKRLNQLNDEVDEREKKKIDLMTGDDNSIERDSIISRIKDENRTENIILVATQVIEAGVDIDMDIGYKDISMLDSEEQFLGRINRSCKKEGCRVYFFDLDSAATVYRHDVRKEKNINLTSENIRGILISKNFKEFYGYVLDYLIKESNKHNDKNFSDFIYSEVNKLNFNKVEERMKLIDERFEYSVFLNRELNLEDGEILEGKVVWDQYVNLLKDTKLDYAEKKVKLSEIISKLNYFIYKVNNNDFSYEERLGDMYYISDGEKYFKNGKFDRENFKKGIGDFIEL